MQLHYSIFIVHTVYFRCAHMFSQVGAKKCLKQPLVLLVEMPDVKIYQLCETHICLLGVMNLNQGPAMSNRYHLFLPWALWILAEHSVFLGRFLSILE
jgi:hypothetical protein